ncbi:MAG: hypothetical protein ACQER4_05405 [Bacteroidota bacterium]
MREMHTRTPGIRYFLPTLFGLVLGVLLTGCQFEAKQRPVLELDRSNPTANGSRYPALASDGPDRVVMAWVSSIEERISTIEVANRIETQWYAPRPLHVGEDLGLAPTDRPQMVVDENRTRWIAWRESRRGGRLVLSRQEEGATGWTHFRIPGTDEGLRQGVPRLARNDSVLIALWQESGEEGATLRLARWMADATGDEMRLDDGAGEGAWLASGVPIRPRGELLGEPTLTVTRDSTIVTWLERTEEQILLMEATLPHGESETSPNRERIGEWTAPGSDSEIHGSLSMARQGEGVLALAVSLEWEEERSTRLYVQESGQWLEETPDVWTDRTGRPVVAAGPEEDWILLWQQSGEPLASLWLQRLELDGTPRAGEPLGEPIRVGSVDSGLQSDRPSLVPLREEGIFLAWTQTDPFLRVRTALVPWTYQPES